MRTILMLVLLLAITLSAGCGGVDNSAVAPENPTPPPSAPPQTLDTPAPSQP